MHLICVNRFFKKNFCYFYHIFSYIYLCHHHQVTLTVQSSLTLSLTIHPYHPSLVAGLLGYILCPYRADVTKSLLVGQHWHVLVQDSQAESLLHSLEQPLGGIGHYMNVNKTKRSHLHSKWQAFKISRPVHIPW